MPATVEIAVDSKLKMSIGMEIAKDICDLTLEEFKKVIHSAVLEELEKSEKFRETIRKLALDKLLELLEK